MNKKGGVFKYLKTKFPHLSDAKIKQEDPFKSCSLVSAIVST